LLSVDARAASSLRSDTIDIRKTIIHFDITDFVNKNILGHAQIDLSCKQNNVNEFVFDLEGLTVDSVLINNSLCTFTQVGMDLKINTPAPFNQNDTALVDVYYHGVPLADPAWGGFSFIGNYGFQMGVGFTAQPHSFGRTWHPCFDNFVERSSYEFFITTTADKLGVCNGWLIDSTINPNTTRTWHWKLNEEIPSYLASVTVCQYVFVKSVLNGLNGPTESWIACEPADVTKVNGSFAHLQESFSMLEERFGAHSWPKVGYSLVPFNAGAMEHATNIHIGKPFVDGSLTYETLIAHELSHHWWGDLVTCSTTGDMWLNEGFASYCEMLHQEYTYGDSAYLDAYRANHFTVLSKAHLNDDGYRSVGNMDSLHTYGSTVYQKGADVIHTLRSYLGDSLFFSGLTSFLNSHKFKHISSLDLRDFLSTSSGMNLTPFFSNWIFDKGFPHFSIDSMQVAPNGNEFDVKVFLRQRKQQNSQYFSKVPLELGFYDAQMNKHIYRLLFDGRCMEFHVRLPFNPSMTILDPDSKISDAISEESRMIKTIGIQNLTQAKCRVLTKVINNPADSSLLRIEHNWVRPDRFKSQQAANGYVLCDSRYWKVDGVNLMNIQGLLHFAYDAGVNNGYLDSAWIKNSDDSIRMFFRKDASEEWQLANDSLRPGSPADRIGNIYVREIKSGEYCFGIKRSGYVDPLGNDAPTGGCGVVTGSEVWTPARRSCLIFPNPSAGDFSIQYKGNAQLLQAEVRDLSGKVLHATSLQRSSNGIFPFNLKGISPGMYILDLYENGQRLHSEKISIY